MQIPASPTVLSATATVCLLSKFEEFEQNSGHSLCERAVLVASLVLASFGDSVREVRALVGLLATHLPGQNHLAKEHLKSACSYLALATTATLTAPLAIAFPQVIPKQAKFLNIQHVFVDEKKKMVAVSATPASSQTRKSSMASSLLVGSGIAIAALAGYCVWKYATFPDPIIQQTDANEVDESLLMSKNDTTTIEEQEKQDVLPPPMDFFFFRNWTCPYTPPEPVRETIEPEIPSVIVQPVPSSAMDWAKTLGSLAGKLGSLLQWGVVHAPVRGGLMAVASESIGHTVLGLPRGVGASAYLLQSATAFGLGSIGNKMSNGIGVAASVYAVTSIAKKYPKLEVPFSVAKRTPRLLQKALGWDIEYRLGSGPATTAKMLTLFGCLFGFGYRSLRLPVALFLYYVHGR